MGNHDHAVTLWARVHHDWIDHGDLERAIDWGYWLRKTGDKPRFYGLLPDSTVFGLPKTVVCPRFRFSLLQPQMERF